MLSSLASSSGLGACRSPLKQPQQSSNACNSSNCSSPSRCGSPIQLVPSIQSSCRASISHSSPVACLSSAHAGASINADSRASPAFTTSAAILRSLPLRVGCCFSSSIRSPARSLFSQGLGLTYTPSGVRGTSAICSSTPAGGAPPGPSSGNDHAHIPRATSPTSTAEPYASAPQRSAPTQQSRSDNNSNNGVISMSSSAAAAAAAEPTAATAALPSAGLATAAAQAETEAAVTATTSVADLSGQQSAAALAGLSVKTELQDLFTQLQFQVTAKLPITQQAATLTSIVKHAAADNIPVAFLASAARLQLLDQLLCSDPTVAVLTAEIVCRACSQDLQPWATQLIQVVPRLLQIVQTHSSGGSSSSDAEGGGGGSSSKQMPLLFFAVSSLVRMSSDSRIANAIVEAGGVPILVTALELTPPAVCQVTTFSLFRLMREVDGDLTEEHLSHWHDSSDGIRSYSLSSSEDIEQELLLIQYVRQGAFSKLCDVITAVPEGSAHELAFSMLLSMALIPQVHKMVADRNEVQKIVKVLTMTERDSTRLEAMLVLGRLAARCVAVQQDAVREGVVPVLVQRMQDGTDEERCHTARLLALLGQHPSTHQVILQAGALPVVLQLIHNRGHRPPPDTSYVHGIQAPGYGPNGQPLHIWQAAHTTYNRALAAGKSNQAASSEAAVAAAAAATPVRVNLHQTETSDQHDHGGDSSSSSGSNLDSGGHQQHAGSEQFSSASSSSSGKQARPEAAAATALPPGLPLVGPSLVLEQAVGVVCMLVHNPDNHFAMVGEGIVPMLVSLLNQETSGKAMTYTLASLLMLAMGEPRHAAVVARAGAVPLLVSVVRENGQRPTNRELGAALLAVLCRSQEVQSEVVAAGGIPALTRLLGSGTDGARCYACECLVQLASVNDIRCRLVVRAGVLEQLLPMLEPRSSSLALMWAARLIKVLLQETAGVKELFETPRIIAMLPELLSRRPLQQQQFTDFRGNNSSSNGGGKVNLTASPAVAAAVPSKSYGMNLSSLDVELQDEGGEGAGDSDLEKAQAHLAWVVAALALHNVTKPVIAEIGSFLVRPLVANLRDSQASHGPGYSLSDVLDGMANCRQASSAAALRAMSRADDRLAALINAELALQLWMGFRVELPRIEDDWPLAPDWCSASD